MAGPITWRTLAPTADPGTAAQLLLASQRSINSAFDPLQKILQQRESFAADQAGQVREGNKQAFLDALQGARSPEELAALQASGQLNVLRSKLTLDNRAAVRGAEDARLTGLRQQLVAGQQFGDGQTERAQLPVKDQIAALTAAGKFTEAQAMLDSNPELRGRALLQSALASANISAVDRSRGDILFGQKLIEQERANRVGAINVSTAEQAAADAAETRRLEERLAREAALINADRDASGLKMGELAKEMGLPLTPQGRPDFSKWDSQQISSFDDVAGLKGLPTSTTYGTGDTVRADNLYRSLAGSGEFSPRVLRANEGAVRGVFSSAQGVPVGNDAVNLALANAQAQVGFDRQDANNAWYAPGSADARKSYDDLATRLPTLIKDAGFSWSNGFNPNEDIPDLQRVIGDIAATGVEVKGEDGKIMNVVPAVNDVLRFIRSSEGSWFSDNARAKDVKAKLSAWLNSKEGMTMVKQGLESQQFRDRQRVQQLFREQMYPSKK